MADTVFWSWQSDLSQKTNRHIVREALSKALDDVSDELGLEEADRLELDHDTKSKPGMADISNTILEKVSKARLFVADVTPIATSDNGKKLPNPNVMVELGYALHALGFEKIIAILNTGEGHKIEDLPFDIRHRRILTYFLAESADKSERKRVGGQLAKDLAAAIKSNIENAQKAPSTEVPIVGVVESEYHGGLWEADWPTEYQGSFGIRKTVFPIEGARAYLRVIPESWPKGIPQITELEDLSQSAKLWAPIEGGKNGDGGSASFGYISYWVSRETDEGEDMARNIAGFLEENGEIWLSDGTVLTETQSVISYAHLLTNWARGLEAANRSLDELGASKRRRVILGISNLDGVTWPVQAGFIAPRSRKPSFETEATELNWDQEQQISFLNNAWNGLLNVFSLPKVSAEEFQKYYTVRKGQ